MRCLCQENDGMFDSSGFPYELSFNCRMGILSDRQPPGADGRILISELYLCFKGRICFDGGMGYSPSSS
jgi:hypothetical protein